MITPPTYKRPEIPSDEDLAPSYHPPPPMTFCETFIDLMHRYHRVYITIMFLLAIGALIWGAVNGINVRPHSDGTT